MYVRPIALKVLLFAVSARGVVHRITTPGHPGRDVFQGFPALRTQ